MEDSEIFDENELFFGNDDRVGDISILSF